MSGRSTSNVSFAGNAAPAPTNGPCGIVRNTNGSSARPCASSSSQRSSFSKAGVAKAHGGACCYCVIEPWVDSTPCNWLSIQLRPLSCESPSDLNTRVGSDQRTLVATMGVSLLQTTERGLDYLLPRVMRAHQFVETPAQAKVIVSNHPQFVARRKLVHRLLAENPNVETVMAEVRIDLGCKVDFELVSRSHDPIYYGRHVEQTNGEVHVHLELKAVSKDSFGGNHTPSHRRA